MKYLLFTIALLFALSTSAQTYKVFKGDTINRVDAKGRKQGLWRKYYQNDTLFSEGYYKDGKHTGAFHTFHTNGVKQSVLKFRGSSEISDALLYNDSAQLIAKGKYIDRNKDSLWIYYDGESGKINSQEYYRNGVKEGTWKIFYANGEVAESEVYKNGMKNGPYLKFFENGKPRMEGKMVNDLLEGKVTLYYSDGKVWQQGVYVAGDKEGIWSTFNQDGSLEKQEEYSGGILKDPPAEKK